MYFDVSDHLRLKFAQVDDKFHFLTDVHDGTKWRSACQMPNSPVSSLNADDFDAKKLHGAGIGYQWESSFSSKAGGIEITTRLTVTEPSKLNPAMILWIDTLDNMNDRQAHTWRQTILRAPTVNQQGLPGNDLPACYLYDHATQTETICYYPPEAFKWTKQRFYDFTMREVFSYRPIARYGIGLLPNSPDVLFDFEPGEHTLIWWFTQRHREDVPDAWEAQNIMLDAVSPLLDTQPTLMNNRLSWAEMAQHTLDDLQHENCWVEVQGTEGLRAYVLGSSSVGRDDRKSYELMTQLDVLFPLMLWNQIHKDARADTIIDKLLKTLPGFNRPQWHYVANNFPAYDGDSFMDTWYFLENTLIKLGWVAYLADDATLKTMFFDALHGARELAHNTNYLFPLFADADGWKPQNSLLNVSVGGLYAAGCVIAYQLDNDASHLEEAAKALLTMHQLPPHQLTHEPQQLSFAAAAAHYLAKHDEQVNWQAIADDFIGLVLRMAYWGKDPHIDFYDPRGMFQACASLCYPAFKENVEVLIAWSELLQGKRQHAALMAAFANLQRHHNLAYFAPFLPEKLRIGPCPYIPYEDLATSEFTHSAKLGKELYGTGEVFWSALLFEQPEQLNNDEIFCLNLDIPCLELRSLEVTSQRAVWLYNPTLEEQTIQCITDSGEQIIILQSRHGKIVNLQV